MSTLHFEKENYLAYSMRVFEEHGSSVNTIFLVRDYPSIRRSYKTNQQSAIDRISGLEQAKRVYYIMFIGEEYIPDTQFEQIMQEFINVINKVQRDADLCQEECQQDIPQRETVLKQFNERQQIISIAGAYFTQYDDIFKGLCYVNFFETEGENLISNQTFKQSGFGVLVVDMHGTKSISIELPPSNKIIKTEVSYRQHRVFAMRSNEATILLVIRDDIYPPARWNEAAANKAILQIDYLEYHRRAYIIVFGSYESIDDTILQKTITNSIDTIVESTGMLCSQTLETPAQQMEPSIETLFCGIKQMEQQAQDLVVFKQDINNQQELPFIITNLQKNPLSLTHNVTQQVNLGHDGQYFYYNKEHIYIFAADINNLSYLKIYHPEGNTKVIRSSIVVRGNEQIYRLILNERENSGYLFLIPPKIEHQWFFNQNYSSIVGIYNNNRVYMIGWQGKADNRLIAKLFIEYISKSLLLDFCVMQKPTEPTLSQIRCSFDLHFQSILKIFPLRRSSVPLQIFYRTDQNHDIQISEWGVSEQNYFTRSYPGMKIYVGQVPEESNIFSVGAHHMGQSQVHQNSFEIDINDQHAHCGILNSNAATVMIIWFTHTNTTSVMIERDSQYQWLTISRLSGEESRRIIVISFSKEIDIIPNEEGLKQVAKAAVKLTLSGSNLCTPPSELVDRCNSPTLSWVKEIMQNSGDNLAEEIPHLYSRKPPTILIETSLSKGFEISQSYNEMLISNSLGIPPQQYFTSFMDSGLFIFSSDLKQIEWFKVTIIPPTSDSQISGSELHFAGYNGALLEISPIEDNIPTLYTLIVIQACKGAEREYSVNPQKPYDKLIGLRRAERIYLLSYQTENGYRISIEQSQRIFETFVSIVQQSYIVQQVRTGCVPDGVNVPKSKQFLGAAKESRDVTPITEPELTEPQPTRAWDDSKPIQLEDKVEQKKNLKKNQKQKTLPDDQTTLEKTNSSQEQEDESVLEAEMKEAQQELEKQATADNEDEDEFIYENFKKAGQEKEKQSDTITFGDGFNFESNDEEWDEDEENENEPKKFQPVTFLQFSSQQGFLQDNQPFILIGYDIGSSEDESKFPKSNGEEQFDEQNQDEDQQQNDSPPLDFNNDELNDYVNNINKEEKENVENLQEEQQPQGPTEEEINQSRIYEEEQERLYHQQIQQGRQAEIDRIRKEQAKESPTDFQVISETRNPQPMYQVHQQKVITPIGSETNQNRCNDMATNCSLQNKTQNETSQNETFKQLNESSSEEHQKNNQQKLEVQKEKKQQLYPWPSPPQSPLYWLPFPPDQVPPEIIGEILEKNQQQLSNQKDTIHIVTESNKQLPQDQTQAQQHQIQPSQQQITQQLPQPIQNDYSFQNTQAQQLPQNAQPPLVYPQSQVPSQQSYQIQQYPVQPQIQGTQFPQPQQDQQQVQQIQGQQQIQPQQQFTQPSQIQQQNEISPQQSRQIQAYGEQQVQQVEQYQYQGQNYPQQPQTYEQPQQWQQPQIQNQLQPVAQQQSQPQPLQPQPYQQQPYQQQPQPLQPQLIPVQQQPQQQQPLQQQPLQQQPLQQQPLQQQPLQQQPLQQQPLQQQPLQQQPLQQQPLQQQPQLQQPFQQQPLQQQPFQTQTYPLQPQTEPLSTEKQSLQPQVQSLPPPQQPQPQLLPPQQQTLPQQQQPQPQPLPPQTQPQPPQTQPLPQQQTQQYETQPEVSSSQQPPQLKIQPQIQEQPEIQQQTQDKQEISSQTQTQIKMKSKKEKSNEQIKPALKDLEGLKPTLVCYDKDEIQKYQEENKLKSQEETEKVQASQQITQTTIDDEVGKIVEQIMSGEISLPSQLKQQEKEKGEEVEENVEQNTEEKVEEQVEEKIEEKVEEENQEEQKVEEKVKEETQEEQQVEENDDKKTQKVKEESKEKIQSEEEMETYRLVCEMIKKAMLSRNPDAVVPECNKKKEEEPKEEVQEEKQEASSVDLSQNVDDSCFEMYDKCNFQGRCVRLCGRFPKLPGPIKDMVVRSIKVPEGLTIEFYSETDFKGQLTSFEGEDPCIKNPFNISLIFQGGSSFIQIQNKQTQVLFASNIRIRKS